MCCIGSVFIFFISDVDKTPIILFFILGLVTILQGLITIPSAKIKCENGKLNFENGTVTQNIEISEIRTFEITENDINFLKENNNKLILQHLELNETEIVKTKSFLKKYIK